MGLEACHHFGRYGTRIAKWAEVGFLLPCDFQRVRRCKTVTFDTSGREQPYDTLGASEPIAIFEEVRKNLNVFQPNV